jgi:hypothetical protein
LHGVDGFERAAAGAGPVGVDNTNQGANQQRRHLEREDAILGQYEGRERDEEEEAYAREMIERGRAMIEARGGRVFLGYGGELQVVDEESSDDDD